MNIYIVEDDINVIKILKKIIKDRNLGNLIGYSTDGLEALEDIKACNPNIILVDLFIPTKNGISIVDELKKDYKSMEFIMISQVTSKDMIAKAYESGVEYYINKPVNAIEVENIIRKVIKRMEMNETLNKIEKIFNKKEIKSEINDSDNNQEIKKIMHEIGIIGEAGSEDIIKVISYLIKENKDLNNNTIKEICLEFTDNAKSMIQRIRRTAATGLSNIASLGIEDYTNPIFTRYSNGLYSFKEVKKEMDYQRGKSKKRGKMNLKKFINGMVFYCNSPKI
ncbi:MAG: response regulator [Firmicutes bacterium]|nr:response regulator [Bacillota bacterium]